MGQQLKLATRSIIKGRYYSLISLLGLSLAIAITLLVALLVQRETSFDHDFARAGDIYRLTWQNTGTGDRFATMFNPFSPQMKLEYDEVEEAARLGVFELTLQPPSGGEGGAEYPGAALARYENIAMVDPSFFTLFDFEFIAGDPDALNQPNSIVMTQAGAEHYFPGEDPIGRTLLLENSVTLTVTGLLRGIPINSHFTPHFYVPLETLRALFDGAGFLENWGSDRFYHYILLKDNVDASLLEEQLPGFLERHDHEWPLGTVDIELQALKDIHFTTDLQDDMPVRDSVTDVIKAPRQATDLVLFSSGAFFLILVASFNFMNLQIARSIGRGKQMGMLKVLGANRRQITEQILLESLIMCALALIIAIILVELTLSGFSEILAVTLNWADLLNPGLGGLALALTITLGLLSGAYPAVLIASQTPSQIIKGKFNLGQGAAKTRSALVLLQFAVSVVLIVVSGVIYSQIQFSLQVPLGFDAENVAVVELDRRTGQHYDSLRNRLIADPQVLQVSKGSIIPTENLSDGASLKPEGSEDELDMRMVFVDHGYFEALGIDLVAGRSYGREFGGDEFQFPTPENPHSQGSIIINETAARRADWLTEDGADMALGQQLGTEHTIDDTRMTMRYTVVGVARDVHFRSLRSEVVPMSYYLSSFGATVIVQFNEGTDTLKAAALIQQIWDGLAPEIPLRMTWLEDSVNEMYAQEHRSLKLVSAMALLAMAVACIGLLAVASLATGLRTREIGLRKILGAGIREIVNLLSWQFVKPVLLANLIAWPLAWLYLRDWLQLFAYRVDLAWVYFALPGAAAVLIAWLTVAGQAWKAARANPIHALRYE
jgi:putative ABC transport system permease protein